MLNIPDLNTRSSLHNVNPAIIIIKITIKEHPMILKIISII